MTSVLQDLSNALAETVESTDNSIVRVNGRRRLSATGIVWSEDGVIVTAHHVVETDEDVTVTLSDGSDLAATVVGRDPSTDIAVLRVQSETPLVPAQWADLSDLKVGNLVLALGKAGGSVQATLGVVSSISTSDVDTDEEDHSEHHHDEAEHREHKHGPRGHRGPGHWGGPPWAHRGPRGSRGRHRGMRRRRLQNYIQTDVIMYPGFSGGPLVDGAGNVRGMNTSIVQGTSIAIPSTIIAPVVEQLLEHGRMKRGYLGITTQPVALPEPFKTELGQETGLLVMASEPESPAAEAGLILGDTVTAFDGESIATIEDLMSNLTGDRIGQTVTLQVIRSGALIEVEITVGER